MQDLSVNYMVFKKYCQFSFRQVFFFIYSLIKTSRMIRGLASVYNIIMIINENQSPEIALIQQEHFF